MKLRNDIHDFLKSIPNKITLVAATKYVDTFVMENMLKAGITNFGENRVDSFLEKYEKLKDHKEINWHFIGHLQKNKAKKVIDKINFLHSLDSLGLAKIINDKLDHPLNCFIEVSINEEESKNGVKVQDLDNFIQVLQTFRNINIVGLMMMSIRYSDEKSLNEQFEKLYKLKDELELKHNLKIPYLSMGMSDDYIIAINHHATHIRLGRMLFE